MNSGVLGFVVLAAAGISAALIVAFRPLLRRYAMAAPNARSSHRIPTPQGGGIAVIAATVAVAIVAILVSSPPGYDPKSLGLVFAATAFIALVGAIDDIRTIGVTPRLALQAVAMALVLAALPVELRTVPFLPWWIERALLLIAGVWFINLTNFMDGIDWMTVAEVVPVTAGLSILGLLGALPPHGLVAALALGGAILGFAPFNRPVARLFLGDVGSLPIGLLLAWLLMLLAAGGHLPAPVLLPLYYVCDATITVVLRIANREPFWKAHRSHFYQRAFDRGLGVMEITARVFAVNVALVALAIATVLRPERTVSWIAIAAGAGLVGWLLSSFVRGNR